VNEAGDFVGRRKKRCPEQVNKAANVSDMYASSGSSTARRSVAATLLAWATWSHGPDPATDVPGASAHLQVLLAHSNIRRGPRVLEQRHRVGRHSLGQKTSSNY